MTRGLTQRRAGELPVEVTRFVGRKAELEHLGGLLANARLVTVTGPGGVGKTRVSLRAASAAASGYRDGLCLAELSGLRDAELLPHTVAACLGLPQSESQLDAVLGYLHDRQLLLILDTCEHLLDACAMMADAVLRTAPEVTVLATSRQPLDVPGEHTCAIPPLPVPGPAADSAADTGDAVELFGQCAAAVVPGFAVTVRNRGQVIRLCQRLDGIPLAIELATVRLRALSLEQLADRLESRFRVLDGGLRTALPRHQTLRTTIEWSHDLCTPAERALWARLSVFAGSFDIAAAEQVCAGDELDRDGVVQGLIGLVDKSVLLREDDGQPRYRLLDTLRDFGAERLTEAAREQDLRGRHVSHYLALATEFGDHVFDPDQLARYRALRREHANLRAAIEYALTLPGRDADACQLVTALGDYWVMSVGHDEAAYWMDKLIKRFPSPSPERARVLVARCCVWGEAEEGREGIAIAERLGDEKLAAYGYLYLFRAFSYLGLTEDARSAGAVARRRLERAGDATGLFFLDSLAGQMHALAGESEQAIECCRRGLGRLPHDGELWQTSYMHAMTGLALVQQGKYQAGAEAECRALPMMAALEDGLGMAMCLEMLGWLAARQQRSERAGWLLGAAAAAFERCVVHVSDYPTMAGYHQHAEEAARSALGADRFDALYQAGAAYPSDALVAVAMSDADALPLAGPGPAAAESPDPLTGREREIAALVAEGLSNREIAERLVISKRTVDAHVEHIYAKLGITSRVQLTNWLRP